MHIYELRRYIGCTLKLGGEGHEKEPELSNGEPSNSLPALLKIVDPITVPVNVRSNYDVKREEMGLFLTPI
jgi:hypothetical protein